LELTHNWGTEKEGNEWKAHTGNSDPRYESVEMCFVLSGVLFVLLVVLLFCIASLYCTLNRFGQLLQSIALLYTVALHCIASLYCWSILVRLDRGSRIEISIGIIFLLPLQTTILNHPPSLHIHPPRPQTSLNPPSPSSNHPTTLIIVASGMYSSLYPQPYPLDPPTP
jgi:hypothetical protein